MADNTPPSGYVINDSNYGTIYIGEDDPIRRQRHIEIHSANDGVIKLFKDGGFEIQSSAGSKSDNITSRASEAFVISGKNIIINADNELVLKGKQIKFESTSKDSAFVLRANSDLHIEADNIKIDGGTVNVGAKTRMFLRSPGPIYINSDSGVTVVEPRISLTPSNILGLIQTLAQNVFGF